jgi:mRNA-degrading endonuclease RelE of RelBE toxin-antitoxin system
MPTFELRFSQDAKEDLKVFKKTEQATILDAIPVQLASEPLTETRNRKPLRTNDLSQWELRVDRYRIFYDVDAENSIVLIKAIGWKDHNILRIRGEEYSL